MQVLTSSVSRAAQAHPQFFSWQTWSLRARFITTAALCLSMTVLLVVSLQTMLASKDQLERVRVHELPAQLQSVAARVQSQLNLSIAGSEALANNTYVQAWIAQGSPAEGLPDLQQAMARTQQSLRANAVFVAAQTPAGVTYYHYENHQLQQRQLSPTDSHDAWYFNFARAGRAFELNLDSNPLSKQLLMFVNYRGEPQIQGMPAAVAGGGMGMAQLAELIRANKIGNTGSVMLVHPSGVVDVHPDAAQSGQLDLRQQPGYAPLLANNWALVQAEQPAIVQTRIDGQDSYVAALYLPDLQRYLVAHMPMAEITAGIEHNRWLALGAGATLLLVGLMVLFPLAAKLLRPLESLQTQIAAVTQSLNLGTRLQTQDRAEIGRMCSQLNQFLERLYVAFNDVRETVHGIHARSASIASGNQDLSRRTETESEALAESAASMEQMTGSVQQNAANARQAQELSGRASAVAIQGGQLMQEVVRNMQSIAQSSERISHIVGVIDGLAFQTNILALNAAVEAARAGEQGRGFAVVASEVRALAQRSGAAAREIRDLIQESTTRVAHGSEHVAHAGQTMQAIVQSVQQVSGLIESIALASQEQAKGLTSVTQSASQIQGVTQQNAALVEEVAAAAAHLAHEAQRLQLLMNAFQISPPLNVAG